MMFEVSSLSKENVILNAMRMKENQKKVVYR